MFDLCFVQEKISTALGIAIGLVARRNSADEEADSLVAGTESRVSCILSVFCAAAACSVVGPTPLRMVFPMAAVRRSGGPNKKARSESQPVPRQNHIGLKAIAFALSPPHARPHVPLLRWLLHLLLGSPGSVREVALENLASANSSRSSSGSACGDGCERRIVCSGCDYPGPERVGAGC